MDRLLNDAEVCKICRSGCDRIEATQCDWRDKDECHNLIVAQLSKADKDWAQWAFEICVDDSHSSGYWIAGGAVMIHQHKCECDDCWKERKKELGL